MSMSTSATFHIPSKNNGVFRSGVFDSTFEESPQLAGTPDIGVLRKRLFTPPSVSPILGSSQPATPASVGWESEKELSIISISSTENSPTISKDNQRTLFIHNFFSNQTDFINKEIGRRTEGHGDPNGYNGDPNGDNESQTNRHFKNRHLRNNL
ncbi:hypothetical protein KUTeg_014631 [Tegillarca granosa]|uniref:Uncharacterized protein n=1 Tax=Tegillarca granosa TaxID=220873 RepID=A0ABQ9ERK9_TEGGR|nr:hypothetical protein KUTeg_014631 [Tegillarca granosa]